MAATQVASRQPSVEGPKTAAGVKDYFITKNDNLKVVVAEKSQNLRRLEAQRNELNAKVRALREELVLLQEPASYVGEVAKVMGKKKVLVKVHPEGKYVVDLDKSIDVTKLSANTRVALRNDSYTLHKILPNKVDPLVSLMMLEKVPDSTYDMVGGLDKQIKEIKEVIELPVKHPELFEALGIAQPKGVLLYGPPGTGKTLIGKAIASEVKSTFFSISSSSLTSKWVGQGEKLVRALFAVARENLPAIIFIDEIDSLLTQRSEGETEGSRRIKTEFLVQLDGATTSDNEMLLILGATNRPQELDEAARRRLTRRLYVPLPDDAARRGLIQRALTKIAHAMAEADIIKVVEVTAGYSGADVAQVCTEAAMGPVREFGADIQTLDLATLRPVGLQDFMDACHTIQSSVAPSEIISYETWNDSFGTRKARPKQSAVVTPSSNGDS
eukprot:m.142790 g.142790  ORF g.142790 m.142790 type:complete len:442 (+) comp16167_c1_seq5:125-1450(+)